MLKKAGIVVAVSAAAALAFTPLAFAGDSNQDSGHDSSHNSSHDSHKHHGKDDKGHSHSKEDNDTSEGNLKNDCQFGNQSGDATSGIFGGTSLLGAVASPITDVVTNAATQTNALNCTNVNVSDLVDSDSNNDTKSAEKTFVDHSFNNDN